MTRGFHVHHGLRLMTSVLAGREDERPTRVPFAARSVTLHIGTPSVAKGFAASPRGLPDWVDGPPRCLPLVTGISAALRAADCPTGVSGYPRCSPGKCLDGNVAMQR